jgi:hypothetical protein
MRRLLFLLVILVTLTACTRKSEYPNIAFLLEQNPSEQQILYSTETADSLSADITLKVFQLPDDEKYPVIAQINDYILTKADPAGNKSYEELVEFNEDYKAFSEEFPGSDHRWFLHRYSGVYAWTNSTVTVMFKEEMYSGGAHQNAKTELTTFDLKTGEKLALSDIVSDMQSFNDLAVRHFRKERDIFPDTSLSDAGFFHPDGVFKPAENFAISESVLLLYYNNYEIAAYSEGETIVRVPLWDCIPYLNERFRFF